MNAHPQETWVAAILGMTAAGILANAIWMLAAPLHWYESMPGVVDFGPFNMHFVRDIGCIYLTAGLALTWAVLSPRYRLPLVAVVALFHGAHAALHVCDTAMGHVSAHHWWLELPTIYVPALLLAALLISIRRSPTARAFSSSRL
jgi:hypothetical protein